MGADILKFWDGVKETEHIHPRDRDVMRRSGSSFDLRCFPSPFAGVLKTAPIVMLYLAPGFSKDDYLEVNTRAKRLSRRKKLKGLRPLSAPEDHEPAWRWWSSRTKRFGSWNDLRSSIAILELCPYHSKEFHDWPLLTALPSSQVAAAWANEVLFPQAEAGKRVVICLRAHKYWGLVAGKRYGKSLFAPETTRHGHMINNPMRAMITKAATQALVNKRAVV